MHVPDTSSGNGMDRHARAIRSPVFVGHQEAWRLDARSLRLEKVIAGDSSKSEVWDGSLSDQETGLKHPVAVKRFTIANASDLENVQREIEILSLVSRRCHSCARFWGWCQDSEGKICVVMTRYEQSLAGLLRSKEGGKLSLPEVRRFGMQIARAVAELHEQQIILSDLKPANVLLDEYNQCILADFGISRMQSSNSRELDGLHGTFNYMSPESFDPETFGEIGTRSDAWSFACCVIEMLSGRVPWAGTSMSAICFKVTSSKESPSIPSELPIHISELLGRCFAFQSEARPSFREIFAVFNSDWGQSASKNRNARSVSLESCQLPTSVSVAPASDEELAQLRAEKQVWLLERENLVARTRSDAARIAKLEGNIVEHQGVNEVLQEQLKLMVQGMKHQQDAVQQARSPTSRAANPHFEMQLAGCQDALNQCMKQKETAKDMLRKESARATALSLEVKMLGEQRERMHAVLQALAAETGSAQQEVAWLQAQTLHDLAALSPQRPPRSPHSPPHLGRPARGQETERRVAYPRPGLDTQQELAVAPDVILQPHGSHVYDWDTDSRSTRASDQSEDAAPYSGSPRDPRDEWAWKMRLQRRSALGRDALSAASTPVLSVQSSWDSGSSTARAPTWSREV